MPPYVWLIVLIVLHPILVTLLAIPVLVHLLRWTGLWARYKYRILLALLAAYAIDSAFALPRIVFAYGLSKGPVIAQHIPLPRSLVLVNVPCGAKCHDWLITGAVDEIISVTAPPPHYAGATTAVRYQAGWSLPGACPHERAKENPDASFVESGYCPLVEPVGVPERGIFLIDEGLQVLAKESARPYTPTYLVKRPPGPVISFFGIEVQDRTSTDTRVLASAYRYEAPGLVGLPPLIGCWNRPDNVIWIMPPGDTGCGFWRWFIWGGNNRASLDQKWLFEQPFDPPDHPFAPPKRAELPPATPAQALEILSRVWDIESYFPRLRDALIDPSNSDQRLAGLIANHARRGNLEGSLIALLAAKRPAALVGLSDRLDPFPRVFIKSGAVLDEMEKNRTFRDDFADTMFLVLQSRWETPKNVDRFLKLMEDNHPGWLCDKLGRIKGSAEISKILKNDTVERNSTKCDR
jgi:hypothetical protein